LGYNRHYTLRMAYLEGFLGIFAGANDDESWPAHAAEALEVKTLQYWYGGHSIVLQSTPTHTHTDLCF